MPLRRENWTPTRSQALTRADVTAVSGGIVGERTAFHTGAMLVWPLFHVDAAILLVVSVVLLLRLS